MTTFKELRDRCLQQNVLYEDPEFPAVPTSVYYSKRDPSVIWKRPKDLVSAPKFVDGGATRFDFDQGAIGDCWYIAAAATMATRPQLLARVVPNDQSFGRDYAGIFHFNFWRYGQWVEVVVDDRLPTAHGKKLMFCSNREDPSEFWSALLEKAYAKLSGSYEAMEGGTTDDALVDFTGGVGQRVNLQDSSQRQIQRDFYDMMYKFYSMNSLMGSCIFATKDTMEHQLDNGLVIGHAYSVTKMAKVQVGSKVYKLLRLRNPWGQKEWSGPWSDRSVEWKSINSKTRQELGINVEEDGEFWMEYGDWSRNFQQLQCCHLPPQNQVDVSKKLWQTASYNGKWVKGVSAGGCGNSPHQSEYWTNPQYCVTLRQADAGDAAGSCWLLVSLMQQGSRRMRNKLKQEDTNIPISFDLYKVHADDVQGVLEGEGEFSKRALELTQRGKNYENYREVSRAFHLEPGVYAVIPSTFHPNTERKFLLRFMTEQDPRSVEVDVPTGPILAPKKTDSLKELFNKYAGTDRAVDALELHQILNEAFAAELNEKHEFEVENCRDLLSLMDLDKSGMLEYNEMRQLWAQLRTWQGAFKSFDLNNSGLLDTRELKSVFKSVGYHVSRRVMESIVKRYGSKRNEFCFRDFCTAMCKIVAYINVFSDMSPNGLRGEVKMSLDDCRERLALEYRAALLQAELHLQHVHLDMRAYMGWPEEDEDGAKTFLCTAMYF